MSSLSSRVSPGSGSNGLIVNADVNASAAIDGTKVSPDFGSQNIETRGGFIAIETNISGAADVAAVGQLRMANLGLITAKKAGNSDEIYLIYANPGDQVRVATHATFFCVETAMRSHGNLSVAQNSDSYDANRYIHHQSSSVQTTDDTVTTVGSFICPTDSAVMLEARVMGVSSDGSLVQTKKIARAYKNDGGVMTALGSQTEVYSHGDAGASAWDADFDLSGTTVRVRVVGAVATTIRWTCNLTVDVGAY